jgi:hypothetical protein
MRVMMLVKSTFHGVRGFLRGVLAIGILILGFLALFFGAAPKISNSGFLGVGTAQADAPSCTTGRCTTGSDGGPGGGCGCGTGGACGSSSAPGACACGGDQASGDMSAADGSAGGPGPGPGK